MSLFIPATFGRSGPEPRRRPPPRRAVVSNFSGDVVSGSKVRTTVPFASTISRSARLAGALSR